MSKLTSRPISKLTIKVTIKLTSKLTKENIDKTDNSTTITIDKQSVIQNESADKSYRTRKDKM